jgi:hypothetical protein
MKQRKRLQYLPCNTTLLYFRRILNICKTAPILDYRCYFWLVPSRYLGLTRVYLGSGLYMDGVMVGLVNEVLNR